MISKIFLIISSYASCVAIMSVEAKSSSFVPRDSSLLNKSLQRTRMKYNDSSFESVLSLPRGGGSSTPLSMMGEAVDGLQSYMKGAKADSLVLLSTTALNAPLCQKLNVSPILGFLFLGLISKTRGWIQDIHTTEMIADLGIVLFLFEMGLHLDLSTLLSMKREVFGIGLGQFTATATLIAIISKTLLKYSTAAAVIVGWSLALSSSAFVLQLLKDKNETDSEYGKSSFGTLLLQDLMVVPLLVITPILAGTGNGTISQAITKAILQISMALIAIILFGKSLLSPLLNTVANSRNNQESTIGLIFSIVFGMSFLTEGLGLSNTLGAFLAGMLIAETPHRHNVETVASPFRGILIGIFFFTVGFEIDLSMIRSQPIIIASTVLGILTLKTAIATAVCLGFGLPLSTSQRVGLVLSQGGEFAFVAFRTARSLGLLSEEETTYLLTCVSLTMALTPALEGLGGKLEKKLEKKLEGKLD